MHELDTDELDLGLTHIVESIVGGALATGRAQAALGRPSQARAAFEQALNGTPLQLATARVELARLEFESERRQEAEALLREADRLLPSTTDCDFVLRLASGWRALGEVTLAERGYRRLLDIVERPDPPRSAQWVGWDPPLSGSDRYVLALACYRLAEIALEADDGDPTMAKTHLDRAVQLGDPNVAPFACLLLVDCLSDYLRPQEGEGLLETAISYDHPEASPEAGVKLGSWLMEYGRLSKAREPLAMVRDQSGHPRWSAEAAAKLSELDRRVADMARRAAVPTSDDEADGERSVRPLVPKRVLIVGAGTGGQYLWTSLKKLWSDRYRLVGFVDDDPGEIPNVPDSKVLGTCDELGQILRRESPHLVWLAMPTATPRRKREVAFTCARHAVPMQVLPTMHELVLQGNLIPQLRKIRIDDVIGEREVRVDHQAGAWLRAQRVMIVGAGTVGRELARKAASYNADSLVIVDRDDDKLLDLEHELKTARRFQQVHIRSGSAANAKLLLETAKRHECQVVLYAAAEGWAGAGADAARQKRLLTGVSEFVEGLPQATEAVERLLWVSDANVALANTPVRALGAVAEAIALCGLGRPVSCAIRIPTVYTAASSIVTMLEREISRGVPLRVPPPPARQRFIHAYEAAELILQAGEIARPGELFAVERGEDILLLDLVNDMLKLHGYANQQEAKIEEEIEEMKIEQTAELAVDDAPRCPGSATDVPDLTSLGWHEPSSRLHADVERLDGEHSDQLLDLARRIPPLDRRLPAWDLEAAGVDGASAPERD